MGQWQLPSVDEFALRRVGELLALKARPGDVLRLSGPLGAGKTAFARAFIGAVHGSACVEVPSPTYSLMQLYPEGRLAVAHLDLYRLQGEDELSELGLEELRERHVLLVEWPELLKFDAGDATLSIALSDGESPHVRRLAIDAAQGWQKRLERVRDIYDFLATSIPPSGCSIQFMQGDASTRSFARIHCDGKSSILMDAPKKPDGPVIDGGQTYSALAHLAEDVTPFVAVSQALCSLGVRAPEIHDADLERGLLRVGDLGDVTFGEAVRGGGDQALLWQSAVDVLIALYKAPPPMALNVAKDKSYALPALDPGVLTVEANLLAEWYWPLLKGRDISEAESDAFRACWTGHFAAVTAGGRHWVLRDYHSPNLIWRQDAEGLDRVGVVDFQDALAGAAEYDLVSLLQDARIDVDCDLEASLLDYYNRGISGHCGPETKAERLYRYAVLGAQRSSKILGIFARLAIRDGKRGYLIHLPRIWRYLERNLAHPELQDLRIWYDRNFPSAVRALSQFETL